MIPRIPSKSRYSFTQVFDDQERRLKLKNQQVEELRGSYEVKQAELRTLIEQESRNLQDVINEKNTNFQELEGIKKQKRKLSAIVSELGVKITEKTEELERQSIQQYGLVDSVKQKTKKENKRFLSLNQETGILEEKAKGLKIAVNELEKFVPLGEKARKQYSKIQGKIVVAEKRHLEVTVDTGEKIEALNRKNKDMGIYQEYLKNLSGQLTTSLRVVREATEELNELLKQNNVPYQFQLPPNQVEEIKLYAA